MASWDQSAPAGYTVGIDPFNPSFSYYTRVSQQGTSPVAPAVANVPAPAPAPQPAHLQFSPNTIGQTTPLAIGKCRLAGQIIWADGVAATDSILDTNFLTFAAAYCEPVNSSEAVHIATMSANGTVFYDIDQGGAIIPANMSATANAAALVESISSMEIFLGGEDQLPSPRIEAIVGVGNVPAFRGLRYVVFKDFPLLISGNSVPNIAIEWRRDDAATLNVSDVIVALGVRRGIPVSVAGVDDTCAGFVCSAQETLIQNLIKHKDAYNYLVIDGSPIKVVRREVDIGVTSVDLTVSESDCVRRQGSPVITYNRADPAALPVGVDIQYADPDQGYDVKIQPARHEGSAVATAIESIPIDYIIGATTSREMAYNTLYRIRTESLSLAFEIQNFEPEVADLFQVDADAGTFYALATDQTYTKDRTNKITTKAVLVKNGATVAGDGGDASVTMYYWPEQCFNAASSMLVTSDGQIWTSNFFSSVDFAVNLLPNPLRRLGRSRAYVPVSYGGITASADSADVVYFVTQNEEPTRVNKNDVNDVVVLQTSTIPDAPPAQCPIHGGKLYFASRFGGVAYVRIVDLANFTGTLSGATVTGGVSSYDMEPGHIYSPTPRGVAIVGSQILIAGTCVGNASRLFYADTATMSFSSISLTHAGAGADGSTDVHLNGAYTDGTYAYFLPAKKTSLVPTQQYFGIKVTPGSPPTVSYFDIRDDTNVHAMAGDFLPWSDGTNLCFLANYDTNIEAGAATITAPFLARRALGSLTPATGLDLTFYYNQGFVPESGAFYAGDYYIGCNNALQAAGVGAMLKISSDFATITPYPQPSSYPPINDAFASPSIVAAGSTTTIDIRQATKEAGEGDHGTTGNPLIDTGQHSVWYLFVPPTSGTVTLTITSYFTGAKAVVYTGSTLGSIVQIAFADSSSTATTFSVTSGTPYRIVIDGEATSAGTVTFALGAIIPASPPTDDDILLLLT